MTKAVRALGAVLAVGILAAGAANATIIVQWAPMDSVIPSVGGTTTVDLVANIPEDDKILGWGLDVLVSNPSIVSMTDVTIGPMFDPFPAPDLDGLAGSVFPPTDGVWGANVLLATIEFTGLKEGSAYLFSGATPADLTEGFAKFLPVGEFADAQFMCDSTITVLPEPGSLALLMLGLLALRRR